MVTINYCPSCGCELNKGSFVCPKCGLDFKDIVENKHLLKSNEAENTIDFFEGELLEGESPLFEVEEDAVEILIDSDDLIGPDGMPCEIPIEISVEGEDDDIQLEIVSENGDDSDIIIEQSEDGGFVIKPNISFPCPFCGATVGEDLVCKSCFAEFTLTPDNSDD